MLRKSLLIAFTVNSGPVANFGVDVVARVEEVLFT